MKEEWEVGVRSEGESQTLHLDKLLLGKLIDFPGRSTHVTLFLIAQSYKISAVSLPENI